MKYKYWRDSNLKAEQRFIGAENQKHGTYIYDSRWGLERWPCVTMSGEVLTTAGVQTGIKWVEGYCRAQDSPTTQNHPSQNVSSAGVEKPCFKSL